MTLFGDEWSVALCVCLWHLVAEMRLVIGTAPPGPFFSKWQASTQISLQSEEFRKAQKFYEKWLREVREKFMFQTE
jgi:hypothetical protein